MRIGDVMHGLSKRPSAVTIGCVELLEAKSVNGVREFGRQTSDRFAVYGTIGVLFFVKLADWETWIFAHDIQCFALTFAQG